MNQEKIYTTLLAPRITEKAALATQNSNQYVFKVAKTATKTEIKQAVEKMFEVAVTGVQTSTVKGKSKRFGRFAGKRKDWKKAYVTLAAGSTIETLSAE